MSDDEYRRVLHQWAAPLLPDGVGVDKIVKVELGFEEGFRGSDVTPADDPTLSIEISYRDGGGIRIKSIDHDSRWGGADVALTMSRLLRDLFRIAGEEEARP